LNFNLWRFEIQHQVSMFRGERQFSVNRRCEGVNQLRPTWIPDPKRCAAKSTKVSLTGALLKLATLSTGNYRLIYGNEALAFHFSGIVSGTKINRKAPAVFRQIVQ